MLLLIIVVMWSFKSVLGTKECDLKACKDVSDYIKNLDECRGTAGLYRYMAVGLSFIPLTGISNFYSGDDFSAVFELAEGIMALILICCFSWCCCIDDDDEAFILLCESLWSFILAIINILRFIICEALADSLEFNYECFVMVVTLAFAIISCCGGCIDKRCWMACAIMNIIVVGVMEVVKDIVMGMYGENAGNGCPFIDS